MAEEFDPLRYIASYPDLIQAYGADPVAGRWHWVHFGQAEGRDPFRFNPFLYGASNPDLIPLFGSHYTAYTDHYIRQGFAAGRSTTSFDYLGYSASNPDLLVVFGTNANGLAQHYIDFGYNEGRSFNLVDAYLYGASNPDVAAAVGDDRSQLLGHYINYGYYEHRPTTGFDAKQYVAANKDLLLAGYANNLNEALHHYLRTGADEGRPTDFDERAYILTYRDLAGLSEAQVLNHWMLVGVYEGRAGDTLYGHDQATHTVPATGLTAAFDRPGDRDWYQLDLAAGAAPVIIVTGPAGEAIPVKITMFNGAGVPVASDTLVPGEDAASLDFKATTAGRDYFSLESAQTGPYRLDVSDGWATLDIGGRNYTDADFASVHHTRYLRIADNFTTVLGANAQAAGIRFVTATSAGGSTTDASAYTTGLTVNVAAGGADIVLTGSGSDHVIAGVGAQTISLGSGNDLVTGKVSTSHTTDGGPGTDIIRLSGPDAFLRTFDLDLAKITGVEKIELIDDARVRLSGGPTATGTYDVAGRVTLTATLLSSAVAFNVAGGNFTKENVGIPNVINFVGSSSGGDSIAVYASDLGPNITADGGGDSFGQQLGSGDTVRLLGGVATDASFTRLSGFEILTGSNLDVHLGAQAMEMGLKQVRLEGRTTDNVVFDPAFNVPVEIVLKDIFGFNNSAAHLDKGTHFVDASQAGAAMRFTVYSPDIQATETLIGSGFATDVMDLTYVVYAQPNQNGGYTPVNLTNVTGIETINVTFVESGFSFNPERYSHGWIYLDTQAGDIQAAQQTINVIGGKGNPEDLIYAPIDASAATANLVISGTTRVKSGSGDDIVTALATSRSQIETGSGNDSVIGGNLSDIISTADGNDILFGRGGADQLDGGTGNDRLRYTALSDSAGATLDTVYNFVSGSDVVDVLNLQGFNGKTINFAGNAANLAAAQALLTPGDGTLDAVFQQDDHSLWFDNGDGVLNASDLHILLNGVASLTAADVLHGSVVVA
ncbi:MAG: hypothetical protein QOI38_1331 [Sphingomonadales bacterium]|jgi:hypothetical protein|nr:hypothetical protein [Sphingomonadales bacterium]